MKIASRGLLALVLIGAIIVVINVRSRTKMQTALRFQDLSEEGVLYTYVLQAKTEGKKKIHLPPPHVEYAGSAYTNTLDSLTPNYGIVIAEPIDIKVSHYLSDSIVTWYRFRAIETLASQSNPQCVACSSASLPEEFQVYKVDEFVIAQYGGFLTIDDIEVTMGYEYQPFKIGGKYVLALMREASSGKATMIGGPAGVFNLTDSEILTPIVNSIYTNEAIKNKYNNSLNNLRRELKAKQPS